MIYFARNPGNGLIKIGHAVTPDQRLEKIGNEWRQRMELLGVISGGFKDERKMHARFDKFRSPLVNRRGKTEIEWFRPDDELMAFIETEAIPYLSHVETPSGCPLADFLEWVGYPPSRYSCKEIAAVGSARKGGRITAQYLGRNLKAKRLRILVLENLGYAFQVDVDEFLRFIGLRLEYVD